VEAEELPGWVRAIGSDAVVRVGVEGDRAWCVRRVPDDDVTDDDVTGWEVFWCEAGGRFEWTRFDDEDAACFYLFGRLAWAEALRGRLPAPRSGPRPPAPG
jgi:hypothetical protein